jgi:hypothetical protein
MLYTVLTEVVAAAEAACYQTTLAIKVNLTY